MGKIPWFLLFVTSLALSNDLVNAPPAFNDDGQHVIPIDFRRMDLTVTLDVPAKTAHGHAVIQFHADSTGYPMLDLVPQPTRVVLNGKSLGAGGLKLISTPDGATKLRRLIAQVRAGTNNRLEVDYDFLSEDVKFSAHGARLGFFMVDVSEDRFFLERYAPSNFEFDAFSLGVTLRLKGATVPHVLFTNGTLERETPAEWQVSFPSYYTTSSFYFHLTERDLTIQKSQYNGATKTVPVIVYGPQEEMVGQAMDKAKLVLRELEDTYGPYAHDKLVVYLTPEEGGMEYCGATVTSLDALGHEITHSWFARGYMPANGNAGWIDEAIASWRDDDYPKATGFPERPAVNLAAFSPYHRTTPPAAYEEGAQLMSELDFLFPNGLKPVLKQFYRRYQHRVATTADFLKHLETQTQMNLDAIFDRYVYGEGNREGVAPSYGRHHPRPFTREQLSRIR